MTQTSLRRDSGTAYTTKELADEVVQYALEPLVYSPGPAEGAEPADWRLKSSADLLRLKVCDPAVGSGAILVAACRYLADRLVEAWKSEAATGLPSILEGVPESEWTLVARRAVTDHCLYGVDRNPMALEMAKLSLWLTTMAKGGRSRSWTTRCAAATLCSGSRVSIRCAGCTSIPSAGRSCGRSGRCSTRRRRWMRA